METLGTWITIAGGVLGLIALFAGILLFAGGSYNKARIQALREDAEDLRRRVLDHEDRERISTEKIKGLETANQHLRSENRLLADMITQRANVEAIADLLEHHHREALAAWEAIRVAGTCKMRGQELGGIDEH